MNDVFWIELIFYLMIWVIGGYFIWKAYRLGIKKDLRYATGPWHGKLKSPGNHIKRLALIELFSGISLLVFAIVIQIFKIELRL